MPLNIGIVGLPNVGKSTLFNALTKKTVAAENFPFCTIDPSVGVIAVPDERLEKLTKLSDSEKTIPTAIQFVDIAGLVKGAAEGEGLGNKFLSNIRETDAIIQVVRAFEDDKITHVSGKVDPLFDIEIINFELIAADIQTVAKRIEKISRDVKKGDKDAVFENQILEKTKEVLLEEKMVNTLEFSDKEKPIVKSFQLLTSKPILYCLNSSGAAEKAQIDLEKIPGKYVEVDAVFETGFDDLIKKSYELLDLITFFTTGKTETRAWTTKRGSTAPIAGTAIHSDFRDKFIRAEIVAYEKLMEAGSYAVAREKGWVRTEGKEYVINDGDVIEFKI